VNAGEGRCQELQKSPETQGEMTPDSGLFYALASPAKVQAGEPTSPADVAGSDKQDDKQPHTAAPLPPDLVAIIDAWETLPEALKAGIVAMVKAAGYANQESASNHDSHKGQGE
jgi:hypothetical protein